MRTQETFNLLRSAKEIRVALVTDGDRIGGLLNEQHPLPVAHAMCVISNTVTSTSSTRSTLGTHGHRPVPENSTLGSPDERHGVTLGRKPCRTLHGSRTRYGVGLTQTGRCARPRGRVCTASVTCRSVRRGEGH